jgi:hypothetical protein
MASRLAAAEGAPALMFSSRPDPGDGRGELPTFASDVTAEFSTDDTDLTESLPPNVALLRVDKVDRPGFEGMPRLGLSFLHRGSVRSSTRDLDRQSPDGNISLAALTALARNSPQFGYWRDAYAKVRNWWNGMDRLAGWLRNLIEAGSCPQLIVWDETGYEVPWELFYCRDICEPGAPQARSEWLGALIPVVRWTATLAKRYLNYTAEVRRCAGPLLVAEALDPDHLAARRPAAALDPFSGYPVVERFGGLLEMLRRLEAIDLEPFGLAVVHAHGEHSPDPGKFTLDGVPLNELDEYKMDALARSGALVLLNACASARPSVDPADQGAVPHSFAEVFLWSGATGVIGTAADIDINQIHEFAVRLLSAASQRDINIAQALRGQRGYHAEKARLIRAERDRADLERRKADDDRTKIEAVELEKLDKKVDDTYKWFFAWSTYLFFGHPATTLRVQQGGQQ